MMDRIQSPDVLSHDLSAKESFSASGRHNAGQGADFIHEEVNKKVKSFLPPELLGKQLGQEFVGKLMN